jgi:hypothetical protein
MQNEATVAASLGLGEETLLQGAHRQASSYGGKDNNSHQRQHLPVSSESKKSRYVRLCEFASDIVIPLLSEGTSPVIEFPLFAMTVQQQLSRQQPPPVPSAGGCGADALNRTGDLWIQHANQLLENLRGL